MTRASGTRTTLRSSSPSGRRDIETAANEHELDWFMRYCVLVALLTQPTPRPWWHRLMRPTLPANEPRAATVPR